MAFERYTESKRLRREAGEWLEEAENELKQKVGRTSLQTTRKSMEGEQGKNFFPCCDQQRKQEIELIKLVNGRGGGGRELYVGYRRAD